MVLPQRTRNQLFALRREGRVLPGEGWLEDTLSGEELDGRIQQRVGWGCRSKQQSQIPDCEQDFCQLSRSLGCSDFVPLSLAPKGPGWPEGAAEDSGNRPWEDLVSLIKEYIGVLVYISGHWGQLV